MINKRRLVLKEKSPEESMKVLRAAGWVFAGPKGGEETAQYWINPRSKRHYTLKDAINLEELHEQLSKRMD